jgi:hypothetical protein
MAVCRSILNVTTLQEEMTSVGRSVRACTGRYGRRSSVTRHSGRIFPSRLRGRSSSTVRRVHTVDCSTYSSRVRVRTVCTVVRTTSTVELKAL